MCPRGVKTRVWAHLHRSGFRGGNVSPILRARSRGYGRSSGSFFRKKIANGTLVLLGVATKASSDKVLKAVVTPFSDGSDVIQGDGEAGKLFFAIVALVSVPLVHLD